MSERGSFTTQYIYCEKCLAAVKAVLMAQRDKYLFAVQAGDYPVIAGKIGGLGQGDELVTFREYLIQELEQVICHPVRFAVLSDTAGDEFFTANPDAE
jgi:hypothetical protein